jgi:hypothetical protein
VANLIQNANVFKLDPNNQEFEYFDAEKRTQLKGVSFRINLNNPITGKKVETYQFRVARENITTVNFKFMSVSVESQELPKTPNGTPKKGQTN